MAFCMNFAIECGKIKSKAIIVGQANVNNTMNQWELGANTLDRRQARENAPEWPSRDLFWFCIWLVQQAHRKLGPRSLWIKHCMNGSYKNRDLWQNCSISSQACLALFYACHSHAILILLWRHWWFLNSPTMKVKMFRFFICLARVSCWSLAEGLFIIFKCCLRVGSSWERI